MPNTTHPFAVFVASQSQKHTIDNVLSWLKGEVEDARLAKWYEWFSKGLTQNIVSEIQTASALPEPQPSMEPVNQPTPQPKPEGMKIISNLQGADEIHKNTWFPYGSILTVTTSDPKHTQYIDVEIRDSMNQLVEADQIDPEFDAKNQMIHLRIKTSFEDLAGETLKMIVDWADASDEEYSEDTSFLCV